MSEKAELTVLVYFASDNPLAPLVVSEIKAIKDAGFQQHTNVIMYFDPMEKGVPTLLYDVNRKRKKLFRERWENDPRKPLDKIGDGRDPFVRNMKEDRIDPSILPPALRKSSAEAAESLNSFVEFGVQEFPAPNFILILLGHGMIVGNDAFLPDDDPVSGISLIKMKEILKKNFVDRGNKLQLLGLHSCSMSSLEVAYQLRGLANYMLATQGTTFVNSWPFRQLTKKTLNHVRRVKDAARERTVGHSQVAAVNSAHINIPELIHSLYFLCLHNATDFLSAGYSADRALCSLDRTVVESTKEPIQNLVRRMKSHLSPRVSLIKDLILLAHWESQSYYSENYTDLYDFCLCLGRRCDDQAMVMDDIGNQGLATELRDLSTDCDAVRKALVSKDPAKRLVLHSDHFGSEYQYSHGLSIYFPWHSPDDEVLSESEPEGEQTGRAKPNKQVLQEYGQYDFSTDFDEDASWFSFLNAYFEGTRRPSRIEEEGLGHMFAGFIDDATDATVVEDLIHVAAGVERTGAELERKRTPEEGSRTPEEDSDCNCPTIKNHSPEFSISAGALRAFKEFSLTDEEDED